MKDVTEIILLVGGMFFVIVFIAILAAWVAQQLGAA